jgi:RNA polymerase sigma-70 factor (ECF subfamily)
MPDERELIEGIIRNDEKSCEKLLNLYKGRIFSYILRLIKNYDDAEELTFETFIKFFKSVNSYDPSRSLSSWLFTIAHNLVIDFLRKNKIEYEYIDEMQSTQIDFFDKIEKEKKLKAIERALEELAPLDKEIVILFHKEELSYQEISDILKIPVTTIKTRLHRARRKLREIVTGYLNSSKL